VCIKRSLLSPRTWLFCHSVERIFLVSRGLAPGRPRQAACSALSDRAGLGLGVPSRASALRAPLRALRDSVSHASSQRRAAGTCVVRSAAGSTIAGSVPASVARRTIERPPGRRRRNGSTAAAAVASRPAGPSPADRRRSAGHATQPADKPAGQPSPPNQRKPARPAHRWKGTAAGRTWCWRVERGGTRPCCRTCGWS
jgi:hypothetical protein